MRFETDVLTLVACICGCGGPGYYRGNGARNWACHNGICDRGWILPKGIGSRITLVFSTVRVTGASRCLAEDLRFAGKYASNREVDPDCQWGTLWWWPCIVTGPK